MTDQIMTLSNANAMPAPTWSWLRMNATDIEVPEHPVIAPASSVIIEGADGIEGTLADFDAALATIDARYPARREAAPGDATDRARLAEDDEALDVPALSTYQERAVKLEEECGPAASFSYGMGAESANYLAEAACKHIALRVPAYAKATVTVRVNASDTVFAVADIRVIAEHNSELSLTCALDSPASGTGYAGSLLSVIADEHARVAVKHVQTLDDDFMAFDNSTFLLDEGARVNVNHTVLGAGKSYTGLAADLWGDTSKIEVDTDYLGAREQTRDFNYSIRHLGRKSESNMDANGVLTGTSKKVLRGTIDLVHGCKGSEGSERETVLLANKGVDNKTVPVILCDEDDVAGNHGATIGHVRDEQLFYMATRGLSADAAENLFVRAKLEEAALEADDTAIRAGVCRLGNKLVPDFEEELA